MWAIYGLFGGLSFWLPAYPAFSFLFCPHPPDPLPGGKGETLGYFMQGAAPLASPGLNPGGTGFSCGKRCPRGASPLAGRGGGSVAVPGGGCRGGGCLLTLPFRNPAGGLPYWSPACPAFSFLSCPHPPDPLPLRGRGGIKVYFAGGYRPRHPCNRVGSGIGTTIGISSFYRKSKGFCLSMGGAGSQGEGGPGEMELSVASDGGV